MLGRSGTCQQIGRQAEGSVDVPAKELYAISLGIGPEGLNITPRRSDVAEANIPIGQYATREDDAQKESDETSNELMTCWTT